MKLLPFPVHGCQLVVNNIKYVAAKQGLPFRRRHYPAFLPSLWERIRLPVSLNPHNPICHSALWVKKEEWNSIRVYRIFFNTCSLYSFCPGGGNSQQSRVPALLAISEPILLTDAHPLSELLRCTGGDWGVNFHITQGDTFTSNIILASKGGH